MSKTTGEKTKHILIEKHDYVKTVGNECCESPVIPEMNAG